MSRIVGCRDMHIAKLTKDTPGGTPTWDKPIRVPSLINVSVSDTVEQSKFYSDDVIEQSFSKTAGKEITIELGYLTTELEALITGKEYKNGVLVQGGDDMPMEVALLFRAPKSKGGFRYMVLYKGTLARTESEYATQEDSVESATVKLVGTFIPLASNGKMAATADSDTLIGDGDADIALQEMITNWFDEVQLPE
ncbi:MAG TPA: hypothetical protein DCW90_06175 [Lachnospiraceae bacterium]|nr:major tail protein [uncultured Lachnoclostridium sp.]HAU85084.1 hypothetical protein [Lachnospiraceae bacterium]